MNDTSYQLTDDDIAELDRQAYEFDRWQRHERGTVQRLRKLAKFTGKRVLVDGDRIYFYGQPEHVVRKDDTLKLDWIEAKWRASQFDTELRFLERAITKRGDAENAAAWKAAIVR